MLIFYTIPFYHFKSVLEDKDILKFTEKRKTSAGQNEKYEWSICFSILKITFLVATNVFVMIIFNKPKNNETVFISPFKIGGVTEVRPLKFQDTGMHG